LKEGKSKKGVKALERKMESKRCIEGINEEKKGRMVSGEGRKGGTHPS
jgi:hypothetical protein